MNFLQPWLLWGLPIALLPVIIHLINQYRHRTVKWGAMMFLIKARKMNKGMARLRQVLILALRVLAILALIFVISRPLAGGWLGKTAGGAPEAVLVLLDRSASMEETDLRSGESKRSTALRKISEMLKKTSSASRVVLIDSATLAPVELGDPDDLLDLPAVQSTSTGGDVPGLLQAGLDYLSTGNQTARADVWLCSDLRTRDWDPENGRWAALRKGYEEIPGIRFAVLGYDSLADDNTSVVVENAELRRSGGKNELILDVTIRRSSKPAAPMTLPITFLINGTPSVKEVTMEDREVSLLGHVIELDTRISGGWGAVSVPGDSNPQDNSFYFVFSEPGAVKIAIVAEEGDAGDLFEKVAGTPNDRAAKHEVIRLDPNKAAEIDWDQTALIIWQGRLPTGVIAEQLTNFIDAGRSVVFYPPENPDSTKFLDIGWGEWSEASGADAITWWRTDSDLLENTRSGSALPVGEMVLYETCSIEGTGLPLVRLAEEKPLMLRARTDRGGAWFFGTWPQATHSSLARDAIAFYIGTQRAIEDGSRSLGRARQLDASSAILEDEEGWALIDSISEDAPALADQVLHAGAFSTGEDEERRLTALNRPETENDIRILDKTGLDNLFGGLEYSFVKDEAGEGSSLVRDIWRIFLVIMAIALIVEAILCIPSKREPEPEVES